MIGFFTSLYLNMDSYVNQGASCRMATNPIFQEELNGYSASKE
jgi:hypothetical protein